MELEPITKPPKGPRFSNECRFVVTLVYTATLPISQTFKRKIKTNCDSKPSVVFHMAVFYSICLFHVKVLSLISSVCAHYYLSEKSLDQKRDIASRILNILLILKS